MGTRFILCIFILDIIFSTGCTTLKRYSSLAAPGTNNAIADIDLFGVSLSRPEPGKNVKSLWDLSADAQSQFIKILNSRYPDNGMFLNSFNFDYMKEIDQVTSDNFVNRDLRLIFSVSKIRKYSNRYAISGIEVSPADRLEYLRISLSVPEDSVLRFKAWNMYTTEYGSVDIASVSFSRTLQLNTTASFSADKGKVGSDVSAGGSSSLIRKEDQAIKYRYLLLNGRISDTQIEMEEEGTREIDLTGNIIADVSLGFYSFPETITRISGLKDNLGEFNDTGKIMIDYSVVAVPKMRDIEDTIKAELEMEFVYRNVVRGSKTFPEWDDRVKYYTGTVKKIIPLFAARDYVPDFYCIGMDGTDKELLKIKASDKSLYELKFRSYEEASDFYAWLMQYFSKNDDEPMLKIGGQTLIFKDNNLTYKQIKGDSGFKVLSYY